MGEVYLAYDRVCSRKVALKRIREDLTNNPLLKKRFLREAKIAADLVHPGVVPVYTICSDSDPVYYTMPYIEGHTLKSLLKSVWQCDVPPKDLEEKTSVSAFLSVFHKICSTVEYVHSRGILHRDLKPDNILIGLFNEVVILDWGAAVAIDSEDSMLLALDHKVEETLFSNMTIPGKIVGTPDYMAPERLQGRPATESTEVYALGVILYQMLTLSFPYRKKKGKKSYFYHQITNPEEVSPYREIPPFLSHIVMKALSADPSKRYQSVGELKLAIEQHMQGTPEWIKKKELCPIDPNSWKLQESILLSKYFPMAKIMPTLWYTLLVSNVESFPEVSLELSLSRNALYEGFGVIMPPVDKADKGDFFNGYGFWLSIAEDSICVSLVKNGLQIQKNYQRLDLSQKNFKICFEKRNDKISLIIDNQVSIVHMDYLPIVGGRIGIIVQDVSHVLGNIIIYESSSALKVSCLAIPDAFLSEHLYDQAIALYQRIVASFPGRREGGEAQFRLGIALLEKASSRSFQEGFSQAIEAFSQLHGGVSAPLEYLGKALVYQRLKEYDEEVKSLLLGLKRYANHPDITRLKDHVIYRFYETIHKKHSLSLIFTLLVLHISPESIRDNDEIGFLSDFEGKIQDTLFCHLDRSSMKFRSSKMELFLIYWSGFTFALPILFQRYWNLKDYKGIADIFYVAADLGDLQFIKNYGEVLRGYIRTTIFTEDVVEIAPYELLDYLESIELILFERTHQEVFRNSERLSQTLLLYLLDLFMKSNLLSGKDYETVLGIEQIQSRCNEEHLKPYRLMSQLCTRNSQKIQEYLFSLDEHSWIDDNQDAFLIFGYWLAITDGSQLAEIHFSGCCEDNARPRCLIAKSYTALGVCDTQLSYQEKRQLLLQKILFSHCLGDEKDKAALIAAYRLITRERFPINS
ncbi:serine/threonine-protein kinase pknD [Chlamydia ibidis]|uniref:Serine/threonine-protein kinase PknD n=2 Tax=Chlamydia ibidis TaxID=1405396 RepID=S7KE24_9CHLA|nr:serine/threonine-protein kinase pknD [Chlamydia ibidis]